MKDKMTPEKAYRRYDKGVQVNTQLNLYDTVQKNENFFIGKQWEGVEANGLPTPVFNFLKRVALFQIATISSDNLSMQASPLGSTSMYSLGDLEKVADVINKQFAAIFERNKIVTLTRQFMRNAAVDGDGATYTYFDPDIETGQEAKGDIVTEIIENTRVLFGNPNDRRVQTQPYIIIPRRLMVDEVRRIAKRNGVKKEDIERIRPDAEDFNNQMDTLQDKLCTLIVYLWKDEETGTVHSYQCTKDVEIEKEKDTELKLYPITWMPWDYVQDCYHGQAMITGLIPNQIFVNKLFAMSMISLMTLAYPKVVYDKTKVSRWSAKVGASIGVNGSVDGVAKIIDPASISPQIAQFIDVAIGYTQKFLGASDVALGDTRPDNTSAIIALQRAAATPMELTKQNLLSCIVQLGEIYKEFMGEYYAVRHVETTVPQTTEKVSIQFDFSTLKAIPCSIDLDAGASSYWSEIANMQTLDNLLMQGKIPTSEYLRRLPNGQISDRESLIALMEAAERGQPVGLLPDGETGGGASPMDMTNVAPPLRGGAGYGELQRKINETGEVPRM